MTALFLTAFGTVLVGVVLTLATAWDVGALCEGTRAFCTGGWWRTAGDYLPTFLILGQLMVVLAQASPFALVRV